jgi:hypothetical protein
VCASARIAAVSLLKRALLLLIIQQVRTVQVPVGLVSDIGPNAPHATFEEHAFVSIKAKSGASVRRRIGRRRIELAPGLLCRALSLILLTPAMMAKSQQMSLRKERNNLLIHASQ